MAQRRHGCEGAFEAYLRARRIPYVAVHEARKALLPPDADSHDKASLKSFDFLLTTPDGGLLAEVKGRRGDGRRLETWVTREDVESLLIWEQLLGDGFRAAFVFVYHSPLQPPDGRFREVFLHRDLWHGLRVIPVRDYAARMRTRSPRWGTVDLPSRTLERISLRPVVPDQAAHGRTRPSAPLWRSADGPTPLRSRPRASTTPAAVSSTSCGG